MHARKGQLGIFLFIQEFRVCQNNIFRRFREISVGFRRFQPQMSHSDSGPNPLDI